MYIRMYIEWASHMLATFINVIKSSITYNVMANGYNKTTFKKWMKWAYKI